MDILDQTSLIHVVADQNPAALSKEQKLFQRYVKQIEECRQSILEWESTMPKINTLIHGDIVKLSDRLMIGRKKFALKLDQNYTQKALTKPEKNKIRKLIAMVCESIFETHRFEIDPELVAVYDLHTGGDYMQEQEEFGEEMKRMVSHMYDIDLENEPTPKSAQEMSEMLSKHMREKMQATQAKDMAEGSEQNAEFEPSPAQKTRKPSAKTLAKEAREQEEAKGMAQSLREIYRKLASSLHPDREPDEQARVRKTQLMQRVNTAYDKKDLFKLLELQLEIEQINTQDIKSIASSRLKHYNKILGEQLLELKSVLEDFEMMFRGGPMSRAGLKPQMVLHGVQADARQMLAAVKSMEADLKMTDSILELKAWLKGLRLSDLVACQSFN
jgi:hypothetical protein